MEITVTRVGIEQIPIVALKGELKSQSADPSQLERALQQLFDDENYDIVVDLRDLTKMEAAGFRVFITTVNVILKKHGQLTFIHVHGKVLETFKLGGFDELFTIAEEKPFH